MSDRVVNVRLTIDEEPMRVLWEEYLDEAEAGEASLSWEDWVDGWVKDMVGDLCQRDVRAEIVADGGS